MARARSIARSPRRARAARGSWRSDVSRLVGHFSDLYFSSRLGDCVVEWSSQRTSLAANCVYDGGRCRIRLFEPVLKARSLDAVKNTLLHEMIHAYLFVTRENANHDDHGPFFMRQVEQITDSELQDNERPENGYNILSQHSFLEGCLESRACEDVQDVVPKAVRGPRRRRLMSISEYKDVPIRRARETEEEPSEQRRKKPRKRANETDAAQKIHEFPRLDLSREGKRYKMKAATASAPTPVEQDSLPDVVIKWKNWRGWEPEEEEEEPLINRRLEKRKKETSLSIVAVADSRGMETEMISPGSMVLYQASSEMASPGSMVLYQANSEIAGTSHSCSESVDLSLALVPVEPLRVAPLRVFERRRNRKVETSVEKIEKGKTMEAKKPVKKKIEKKSKAIVPSSTMCPICEAKFAFDTTKAEDNAKFNTHIDLCLNGGL